MSRTVTLEQSEEVTLSHQGAEINATTIQYTLPPKGSNQRVGTMTASRRPVA